ncbi:uncharacterized protein LOC116255451 [Nymphaea colorata]|uniref:uncharacterized protein LOC116255451 n=1 Tax=Nymphaea colorata TaxID=210225 RepID=UPI00214F367A|nr:uncharacterized protein LOC116255451 [Nymphaea colorata]
MAIEGGNDRIKRISTAIRVIPNFPKPGCRHLPVVVGSQQITSNNHSLRCASNPQRNFFFIGVPNMSVYLGCAWPASERGKGHTLEAIVCTSSCQFCHHLQYPPTSLGSIIFVALIQSFFSDAFLAFRLHCLEALRWSNLFFKKNSPKNDPATTC